MDQITAEQAMEDLTMALLYLSRFKEGRDFGAENLYRAWKGYDFDAVDSLDVQDLIVNPARSKYVYLTESGREKAREILSRLRIEEKGLYGRFMFRTIREAEAAQAAEIEQVCFPPHEACSPKHMEDRIQAAPELFLVAEDRKTGRIAGFLNGIATDEARFRDEFFTDASLHTPDGRSVMLLGLDVLPEYRHQGLARELMFNYCRREQAKKRYRLVLTCLESKVKMYKKLGYRDLGLSGSVWGGEHWHEMEIILNPSFL